MTILSRESETRRDIREVLEEIRELKSGLAAKWAMDETGRDTDRWILNSLAIVSISLGSVAIGVSVSTVEGMTLFARIAVVVGTSLFGLAVGGLAGFSYIRHAMS